MLCEVERKKCYLDPLTRPSLMPNVISHWEQKFLFFPLVRFFTIFIFMGCFEVGTVDLMLLIEDLILIMIILILSWQKVNLPSLKATLHAPRMWDVVYLSLLHRKQEASVVSFHLLRFLGEDKVSYVDDMQNEERFTGIASNYSHEKFCWI